MIRLAVAISSALLVSACMETSEMSDMTEPLPIRADNSKVPDPMVLVGAATAGQMAASSLASDGLSVVAAFDGRAAGITAFCSGYAHILVLEYGRGFTSAERDRCKSLQDGWGWSAFGIQNGDVRAPIYVRYEIANDLIERGTSTFSL